MERKKPIEAALQGGLLSGLQAAEAKKKARVQLLERRKALSEEWVRQASAEICQRLKSHPWFQQAEAIYFYYPLGQEASLLPLAEHALACGAQAAFPRVSGAAMEFFAASSLEGFREGSFHVMEPVGGRMMQMEAPLVLVPGVGFDLRGTRMGYGKGYYDRYFARYPKCRKIGIAYEAQLVERLPEDAFDVPMDAIATEKAFYSVTIHGLEGRS